MATGLSRDVLAVRFQRTSQGGILLIALIFKSMPIVYLVLGIMAAGLILGSARAPFAWLYLKFARSPEEGQEISCALNLSAERFACAMGTVFIGLGIGLYYAGIRTLAWALVGVVASLSLVAGIIGFCLGSAVYHILRRRFGGHE